MDVVALEKAGVHGVLGLVRVVDDIGRLGGFQHVGGKAVARGKVQPPGGGKPFVPGRAVAIQRGLGGKRDHGGTGGRNGKGRRRIAAHARAVEDHTVEIVENP